MHNDDENIPYNDNIDYIIVDIKLFILNINQYFHENINIKDKKVIKFLNIMVDDNYLKLKFDQEKFIWTNLKGTIIYEN